MMNCDKLNKHVLVLNTTYEPINICTVKRAIILIFKGSATMIEEDSDYVHSISTKIKMPSVIKLNRYIKIPKKPVELNRKNVLIRDEYTCQYCGKKFPASELTIDHIIPRVKGGKTTWDNVVACCKKCNEKKGGKTLVEAGMKLIKKPSVPTYMYLLHIFRHIGSDKKKWKKYLYGE